MVVLPSLTHGVAWSTKMCWRWPFKPNTSFCLTQLFMMWSYTLMNSTLCYYKVKCQVHGSDELLRTWRSGVFKSVLIFWGCVVADDTSVSTWSWATDAEGSNTICDVVWSQHEAAVHSSTCSLTWTRCFRCITDTQSQSQGDCPACVRHDVCVR